MQRAFHGANDVSLGFQNALHFPLPLVLSHIEWWDICSTLSQSHHLWVTIEYGLKRLICLNVLNKKNPKPIVNIETDAQVHYGMNTLLSTVIVTPHNCIFHVSHVVYTCETGNTVREIKANTCTFVPPCKDVFLPHCQCPPIQQ